MLYSYFMVGLLPAALAAMDFINPPPSGPQGDVSGSPAYELGSVVEVEWTPGNPGKPTSLTLWQLDPVTTGFFGDMEYITRKSVDVTKFSWLVATKKDLAVSNLFFLSIFEDGQTSSDSNSHYFNITQKRSLVPSSTITTSTGTTTTTSTSTSSSSSSDAVTTPIPAPDTVPTVNHIPPAETAAPAVTSSDGLPTPVKIGIGIAIPCAVILGAVAGYMLFRRRKDGKLAMINMFHGGNSYNNNNSAGGDGGSNPNNNPAAPGILGGQWGGPWGPHTQSQHPQYPQQQWGPPSQLQWDGLHGGEGKPVAYHDRSGSAVSTGPVPYYYQPAELAGGEEGKLVELPARYSHQ